MNSSQLFLSHQLKFALFFVLGLVFINIVIMFAVTFLSEWRILDMPGDSGEQAHALPFWSKLSIVCSLAWRQRCWPWSGDRSRPAGSLYRSGLPRPRV